MVSGRQPTAHGSCAKACSSYSMFPPTQCGGDWIVRGKGGSRHWTKRPKGERTEVERNSHWVDKTRTTKNRVGRTTVAAKARPSHGTQGLALGEVKKGEKLWWGPSCGGGRHTLGQPPSGKEMLLGVRGLGEQWVAVAEDLIDQRERMQREH